MVHLMKGSMGSGILGMPRAVQNGGLWFSLAVTPVVGFICTYCVHMLVRGRGLGTREGAVQRYVRATVADLLAAGKERRIS